MPSRLCKCMVGVSMVLFTLCTVFTIGKECGPAEYKTDTEECCPMCGKGLVVRKDCTSNSSTTCIPCIRGTYMDEPNGLNKCRQCQTCDAWQGLNFLRKCTTTSNSVCDVKDGFYCQSYSNHECNFALKHAVCTPGGYPKVPGSTSDCESISPALVQMKVTTGGMERQQQDNPQKGTKTANTLCEECPDGYFSTNGINCTAWTKCSFYQRKTAEGSKIKDTVCENIQKRDRKYLFLPSLGTLALLLVLIGQCLCEWRKGKTEKSPTQETQA